MAIHLMCLTSAGGLPIFTKKKGDCDNVSRDLDELPFSTVASLNGVHMFCKSQGVELNSTQTDDWILLWRDYENVVTLITAGKGMTEKNLQTLMDLVFYSFCIFVSLEDLKSSNNFERIKREAKNYMPIIDKLLESCDSELLSLTDCILATENSEILSRLNDFSIQFGSLFCTIVINQKVAVATEGWWDLHVIDQKLLVILLNSSNTTQKDVPVFLPKRSPNIAYRFLTIPITGNSTVCVICGSEPPYHEAHAMVQQIFKNDLELLQNAERCIPRNFPHSLEIDQSILGILLINKISKKYVISRNLQQSSTGKRAMSGSHRLDILRTFFNQAVDLIDDFLNASNTDEKQRCKSLESYWCSEYHKCDAYSDKEGTLICVLYVASIPTYTMRLMTQRILSALLQERTICW